MSNTPIILRANARSYPLPSGAAGLTGLAVEELAVGDRVTPLGIRTGEFSFEPNSLYRIYTGAGFHGVGHASQLYVAPTLEAFLGGLRLDHYCVSEQGEIILYVSATRARPFRSIEVLVEVCLRGPASRSITVGADENRTTRAPLAAPGGFLSEGPTVLSEPRLPTAPAPGVTVQASPVSDAAAAAKIAAWLDSPDTIGRIIGAEPTPSEMSRPLPINSPQISAASTSGGGFAATIDKHPRADMKC